MNLCLVAMCGILASVSIMFSQPAASADPVTFPKSAAEIAKPMEYDAMRAYLDTLSVVDFAKVTEIAKSPKGRGVMMVRLNRGKKENATKVFFLGSQHGDEHAGKDALLFMINEIVAKPELLPENVDLTIIPMFNPDGTEADQRRNGADADLNRDHIMHDQPEIKALYENFQQIMPHVFVDCHEYERDSESWRDRGIVKWPMITMGSVNNPYVDEPIRALAAKWVKDGKSAFDGTDITYDEYRVGGAPPDQEVRFSTTDTDDARNGTGIYGTVSFIIESGRFGWAQGKQVDLGKRVDAYHRLLWFMVKKASENDDARKVVADGRTKSVGEYIPVNYFWGNVGDKVTALNAIDVVTSKTVQVQTVNFMGDLVVKRNVRRPIAYAIPPSATVGNAFAELLKMQAIPYETLKAEKSVTVEPAKLLSVEEKEDPIYNRFDGRQIAEYQEQEKRTLPAGTIIVSPTNGQAGRRACILLEPLMLYSIYQYPAFRKTVGADGIVPVLRIVKE
ncbi:MAG: M14 family zinc carboxypeptidase [Candidatus Sumerlaeota bacterium]